MRTRSSTGTVFREQRTRELEALPSMIGGGSFDTSLDLTLGEGVKEAHCFSSQNKACVCINTHMYDRQGA